MSEKKTVKLIDLAPLWDDIKQYEAFSQCPNKINFVVKNNGLVFNNYIIVEHKKEFEEPKLKNLLLGSYLKMDGLSCDDSVILTKDQYEIYKKLNKNYKMEVIDYNISDHVGPYGYIVKFKYGDLTYAKKIIVDNAFYYFGKDYNKACERFLMDIENDRNSELVLDMTDCWRGLIYKDGVFSIKFCFGSNEDIMRIPKCDSLLGEVEYLIDRLNPN